MKLVQSIIKFFRYNLLHIRNYLYCMVKLGYYCRTWHFWGLPILYKAPHSKIIIGNNFLACSLAKYNQIGVNQKVTIKATAPNAEIIIGNNVGISGCTISSAQFISIGDYTMIGSGVLIIDNDAHPITPHLRKKNQYTKKASVKIEANVFIGARSIILKGVVIGENSVIGAGSVVTSNIPSNCIAAGNPAKIIKMIKVTNE